MEEDGDEVAWSIFQLSTMVWLKPRNMPEEYLVERRSKREPLYYVVEVKWLALF